MQVSYQNNDEAQEMRGKDSAGGREEGMKWHTLPGSIVCCLGRVRLIAFLPYASRLRTHFSCT